MKRIWPARATSGSGEYFWDEYRCEHDGLVLDQEVDEVLSAPGITERELEVRLGELSSIIELAQEGGLKEDEDHKPVSTEPEMWELRIMFGGIPFRLYYAEPQRFPQLLIGLKAHFKSIQGSALDIRAAQNREIELGVDRYLAGRARDWQGVDGATPCNLPRSCIDPRRPGI